MADYCSADVIHLPREVPLTSMTKQPKKSIQKVDERNCYKVDAILTNKGNEMLLYEAGGPYDIR